MTTEYSDYHRLLTQNLVTYLRLDELRRLSDVLGVRWSSLAGTQVASKSQALILHLVQRDRIGALVDELCNSRPEVQWREIQAAVGPAEDPYVPQPDEYAFENYISDMGRLLHDHNLWAADSADGVRVAFQTRTLEVLPKLDGRRKGKLNVS